MLLRVDGDSSKSLQTNKEYVVYRKNTHLVDAYKIKDRSVWKKFVVDYYRFLRDTLLESKYGVFLPEVGYFFNFLSPVKRVAKVFSRDKAGVVRRVNEYNFHTNGHRYVPMFVGVRQLGYFKADGFFSTTYCKGFSQRVLKMRDYGSMVSTLTKSGKI